MSFIPHLFMHAFFHSFNMILRDGQEHTASCASLLATCVFLASSVFKEFVCTFHLYI